MAFSWRLHMFVVVALLLLQKSTPSQASPEYSEANALKYLMYAYASYCPPSSVSSWSCEFCNGSYSFQYYTSVVYEPQYLYGFVGYDPNDNEIVVSFRGTVSSSIENWIVDLESAELIPWPDAPSADIMVADGFYNSYSNYLSSQVDAAVTSIMSKNPSASLTITGHSLGAAFAHICAGHLLRQNIVTDPSTVSIFTYGQPRTGNAAFANWFDSQGWAQSWRVVNFEDIVPHVPTMSMGFHHNAIEVYYDDMMQYTICDGSGEDPNCSDQFDFPTSVYDHLHYLGVYEDCESSSSKILASNKANKVYNRTRALSWAPRTSRV